MKAGTICWGENEKWYYTSCGNANVEMKPYLDGSGRVCYSLRQFCPSDGCAYGGQYHPDQGR